MSSASRYANGNARRKVREWLKAQGMPCHLCGRAIDYSLPAGDPMSFEVDEIVPVSKGGSPIDKGNVAAAHRICNQRRGNKPLRKRLEQRSASGAKASIDDALGPRPCDLGTEDATRF